MPRLAPSTAHASLTPATLTVDSDVILLGQHALCRLVWDGGEHGGGDHAAACLFGVVRPEHGNGAAVVLPCADVEAMTIHLAEISRSVTHGAHAVFVLDQAAGWQASPKLDVPDNTSLLPPLPCAPDKRDTAAAEASSGAGRGRSWRSPASRMPFQPLPAGTSKQDRHLVKAYS